MRSRRRPRRLRPREQVLGRRAPGRSFLHRAPGGLKVLVLAIVTAAVLLIREPMVSLGVVVLVLVTAGAARVPLRMILVLVRRLWLLLTVLVVLQLMLNDLFTTAEVLSRILACLLAAQLLMLTTEPTELVGVLRRILTPLRFLGVRPGRVALAALITLRSIPYLADTFHLAGQQARARGLERDLRARTVPLLLGAVNHARNTGRALNARGIEEV
ncbi:CbiQ family ECF transporter T component [Nesterenkonia sphaerica]|uniref:Energy-coupling factor transporter transmembrane protein EcfT n=1 Tax=Nesterenkonia sphaerica TaxID=1804988 RepID=A0A5R9AE22_9MICC|nr:CbiQ family ECF transporter T component [Nesterenkonia sphaerica]TLP76873.1 energy-coupling factor transporter transmembrane protein EcfT [Nesterenkonia sphaerica]